MAAWVAGGWVLFGLVACSSDDSGEVRTLAQGVSHFCRGYCASARRCVETDGGCERRCAESYRPEGVRPSALAEVGSCLQEATDCSSWSTESPSSPCWDRVSLTTEPAPIVVDYCESATLEYFECGAWWGVDECLTAVWLFDDDVLSEALACHAGACDELFACEAAIWERL